MWWDPREDRIAILLTQRADYPALSRLSRDWWTAVNEEAEARRPT
jgi:hypothetical protein